MLCGNVMNQLLNEDRLAYTGASKHVWGVFLHDINVLLYISSARFSISSR